MKRASMWVMAVVLWSSLNGCIANNRIVSSGTTQANNWFGELGITGHNNNITIRSGSDLERLSVIGNGNQVRVEPRCTLGKIEVWGKDCQIFVPEYMVIRKNVVGNNSAVVTYNPFTEGGLAPAGSQWIETLPGDSYNYGTGDSGASTAPPAGVMEANPGG